MAVDILDWAFDSHDTHKGSDLDTHYESPIHDWDDKAQREVDHEDVPEMTHTEAEPVR